MDARFTSRVRGPGLAALEPFPHIHREGWDNKGNPSNEKTAYFAEYNCKGPGANRAGRVKWSHQLEKDEARQFETENFLKGQDGWNPKKAEEHL